MRYLTTALIAEGTTDDRFLPRLLARALYDLCARNFDESVEIPDVVALRDRSGPSGVEQILKLVQENCGSFAVVFVHRDQGGNQARFNREWREPLTARWPDGQEQLVMVVPVRETEAWVLADGDALRKALGVRWSDVELGVPARVRDVEAIEDPKAPLARIGKRVGRPLEHYLDRLSELVSLEVLEKVSSFRQWREDTARTLVHLGFRRKHPGASSHSPGRIPPFRGQTR